MDILRRFSNAGIVVGIVLAILGLLFIIFPVQVVVFINWILGGALLIGSISGIVRVVSDKNYPGSKVWGIIPPVVFGLLAIFLIITPGGVSYILGTVVGMFAIFAAVDKFSAASMYKKAGEKVGSLIIMGVVNLVFAFAMIMSSFSVSLFSFMIIFIGAYMIAQGVMICISTVQFKHRIV